MPTDLAPGTITTLGNLRPGDVGEFIDKTLSPEIGRFLVNSCIIGDCVYCLNDDRYYEGYRKVKTAVRYLGRGRIEPAKIVMDSKPDRIAELEAQVRTLREALDFERVEMSSRVGCSEQFAKFGPCCNHHECHAIYRIRKALAATAPKGEP